MNLLSIYGYLIIIFANCTIAEYVVRVDRFDFVADDKELVPANTAVIEQEGNRSYLSGHIEFGRPLKEVLLVASLDMSRARKPRVRLFDTKLDLCAFFNNNYKSKFLRQFHLSYVSFINIRPSCPFRPHVNYSLTRGYLDDRLLPELLPECSYFMRLEFRNKTNRLAVSHFSGHITPVKTVKKTIPKFGNKLKT